MDFAERQKTDHPEHNVVKSAKFWRAVEKKNMVPDRSAQSMRGAYKKFAKYSQKEFMTLALTDGDNHKHFWYTHSMEYPPIFGPGYMGEGIQENTAAKTEAPCSNEKKETQLEQDHHSEGGRDSDGEDLREFLIADDPELWSCISYRGGNQTSNNNYNL